MTTVDSEHYCDPIQISRYSLHNSAMNVEDLLNKYVMYSIKTSHFHYKIIFQKLVYLFYDQYNMVKPDIYL